MVRIEGVMDVTYATKDAAEQQLLTMIVKTVGIRTLVGVSPLGWGVTVNSIDVPKFEREIKQWHTAVVGIHAGLQ